MGSALCCGLEGRPSSRLFPQRGPTTLVPISKSGQALALQSGALMKSVPSRRRGMSAITRECGGRRVVRLLYRESILLLDAAFRGGYDMYSSLIGRGWFGETAETTVGGGDSL